MGLLYGYLYFNLGILPLALSRKMTQVAWGKHGTGVRYHRSVDGYVMYTGIDFEYHSYLSTTFNPVLN